MLASLILTYAVHAISPSGKQLATEELYGRPWGNCTYMPTKAWALALARNGTVALLLPPNKQGDYKELLVIRPDNSRTNIGLPPAAILKREIYVNVYGAPTPHLGFGTIRLADDGTPFATVVAHYGGAMGPTVTAGFRWSGIAWQRVPPYNAMPSGMIGATIVNTTVAAVDNPTAAAFNGVYGQLGAPDLLRGDDPTYLPRQAEFMSRNRVVALGIGTATAMRDGTIVGFRGGLNAFSFAQCEERRKTIALQWRNANAYPLGRGIAYDINSHGDIVGDDEDTLGAPGRPILWRRGRASILDQRAGSAFAIADDGVVVGRIGDSAFIVEKLHSRAALLDNHIADRAWHIIAAYGIASTGRILAIGNRRSEQPRALILDPILRSR